MSALKKPDVEKAVLEVAIAQLYLGRDEITLATEFSSVAADSLDLMELIMEVEQQLNIEVDTDEGFGECKTVGALADFIWKQVGE